MPTPPRGRGNPDGDTATAPNEEGYQPRFNQGMNIKDFLKAVVSEGYLAALYRFGLTNDDLDRILEAEGLSPEQISNLRENEQFRDGIRSGDLPSPDLRDALDDIESLEGRADEILDAGGQTDQTQELYELGVDLVRERGFTPEFRGAFDRLLDVVTQDEGGLGGPGTTSAFRPAFDALQKIVGSEGSEGAGILPLEDVVGLLEAQAGQRSAQIAESAQRESARRGLGPGAVTSGTEVGAESGQLQLNQETQAVAQALQSNQALRGQAVSQALQNLTKLAEVQRNDPVRGQQADVLGDLIRATVTNIQTGANLGISSQRLANERLTTALQTSIEGNRIQAGVGVDLQNQLLQSLGISAGVAQSGQQNYLQAIGAHQNLGMGLLDFAGKGVSSLQQTPGWLQNLLGAVPGLINAGRGVFGRPPGGAGGPGGTPPPGETTPPNTNPNPGSGGGSDNSWNWRDSGSTLYDYRRPWWNFTNPFGDYGYGQRGPGAGGEDVHSTITYE